MQITVVAKSDERRTSRARLFKSSLSSSSTTVTIDPHLFQKGHAGGFIEARPGFMLKKLNSKESRCLELLMKDDLKPFVPEFKGVVDKDGKKYVEMKVSLEYKQFQQYVPRS